MSKSKSILSDLNEVQLEEIRKFKEFTVAHPMLRQKVEEVLAFVKESVGSPVVLVYGPAGVGKSTLLRKLHEHLVETSAVEMEQDRGYIPVAGIEAVASEREFHWGDYFYRALVALEEPLIDYKVVYGARGVRRNDKGALVVSQRTYNPELRRALENALKYRKVKAFTIDEAQHLDRMVRGRKEEDQIDIIKSLANLTKTVHVLAGTYGLMKFRNLDDQLSRRTINIHLPRYKLQNPSDQRAFLSVLMSFFQRLPVMDIEPLMQDWEFFYERSIGCVGTLKDWHTRALIISMLKGDHSINLKHFTETALSVSQCEKIAKITIEGEKKLEKEENKRQSLRSMLGFKDVSKTYDESKLEVSKSKRNVGERSPHRDPIGVI